MKNTKIKPIFRFPLSVYFKRGLSTSKLAISLLKPSIYSSRVTFKPWILSFIEWCIYSYSRINVARYNCKASTPVYSLLRESISSFLTLIVPFSYSCYSLRVVKFSFHVWIYLSKAYFSYYAMLNSIKSD